MIRGRWVWPYLVKPEEERERPREGRRARGGGICHEVTWAIRNSKYLGNTLGKVVAPARRGID